MARYPLASVVFASGPDAKPTVPLRCQPSQLKRGCALCNTQNPNAPGGHDTRMRLRQRFPLWGWHRLLTCNLPTTQVACGLEHACEPRMRLNRGCALRNTQNPNAPHGHNTRMRCHTSTTTFPVMGVASPIQLRSSNVSNFMRPRTRTPNHTRAMALVLCRWCSCGLHPWLNEIVVTNQHASLCCLELVHT